MKPRYQLMISIGIFISSYTVEAIANSSQFGNSDEALVVSSSSLSSVDTVNNPMLSSFSNITMWENSSSRSSQDFSTQNKREYKDKARNNNTGSRNPSGRTISSTSNDSSRTAAADSANRKRRVTQSTVTASSEKNDAQKRDKRARANSPAKGSNSASSSTELTKENAGFKDENKKITFEFANKNKVLNITQIKEASLANQHKIGIEELKKQADWDELREIFAKRCIIDGQINHELQRQIKGLTTTLTEAVAQKEELALQLTNAIIKKEELALQVTNLMNALKTVTDAKAAAAAAMADNAAATAAAVAVIAAMADNAATANTVADKDLTILS